MTRSLNRRKKIFRNMGALLIYCMVFQFPPPVAATASGPDENAGPSPQKEETLVAQGIHQYEQGERDQARETFEQAKTVFPESDTVPFYLGMIYLEAGQRSGAITEWQRYVQLKPDSDEAMKIRKYLTLLLREEAVAYAKQAVADEATLTSGPVADNTVAVTVFNNLGSETLSPLGKGFGAMLISDLSQVPDLQVVERVKLQALLQELDLGLSGVVAPETIPRIGRFLKSRHVTAGSLIDPEKEQLQIISAVVDTERPDRIDTREAQGLLNEFFNLEKQIACGIIETLGRNCTDMPKAFNKIHTRSLTALTFYAVGLDYLDQEQYEEAREQFQKAVDEDPGFDLAKDALLAVPLLTMLYMTLPNMISSISETAASSAATVGSTTTAGSAATAGSMGATGMTTAAITGAAAVAGVAVALGGGGGDGDGDGDADSATSLDLTGSWAAVWADTTGKQLTISLEIIHTDTSISGAAEIAGEECTLAGSLSGTIEGSNLQTTISGTGTASISATCTNSSMNGTFDVTSGDCSGNSGNISFSRAESVIIRW